MTVPIEFGTRVAVYTVDETALKLLIEPLPTVTSDASKFTVGSFVVNVSWMLLSSEDSPLDTS
ncbi:hypothetical protein GCM10009109_22630 [Marinobacterium sediminicola]